MKRKDYKIRQKWLSSTVVALTDQRLCRSVLAVRLVFSLRVAGKEARLLQPAAGMVAESKDLIEE